MRSGIGQRFTCLVTAEDKRTYIERFNIAVGMVGVAGALVAIAVAATNDRPASAVAIAVSALLVIAAGLVYLWSARSAKGQRRYPRIRFVAAAIATIVGVAVVVTLTTPSLRRAAAHDLFGFADVSRDVTIVSIVAAQSPAWYRLDVTARNMTSVEQLVGSAEIAILLTEDYQGNCQGSPAYYRINENIRVTPHGVEGEVQNTPGPTDFTTPVTGGFHRYCSEGVMTLTFSTRVVLAPREHTQIVLDLPKQYKSPEPFPYPDDYILPASGVDEFAAISLRAASVFRVTICVADPLVPVTRHHIVDTRPPPRGWEDTMSASSPRHC